MTAIADLVSAAERERLERRLAELCEVDQLLRQIPAQQPAAEPPSLMALSASERTSQ
jgi:hypothetical protein